MTLKFIKNLFLKYVLSAFKPASKTAMPEIMWMTRPITDLDNAPPSTLPRHISHISWGSVDVRLRKPYR